MKRIQEPLRGKLVDGLLVAITLFLASFITISVRHLTQAMFGMPGLFVIGLVFTVVALILVDRSLSNRYQEVLRSWFGMIAGVFSWQVAAIAARMDGLVFGGYGNIILLILIGTLLGILMKRILPVGLRYASVTLLLSWLGQVIYGFLDSLQRFESAFHLVQRISAGLSILALGCAVMFLFLRGKTLSSRLQLALVVWTSAIILLFIFGPTWITG